MTGPLAKLHKVPSKCIRIISGNVDGKVRNITKLNMLIEQLAPIPWSVLCLQEHHMKFSADVAALVARLAGPGAHYIFTLGDGKKEGTLTISKFPIKTELNNKYTSALGQQGAWEKCTIITPSGDLEIVNTYAPRDDSQRRDFFVNLPDLSDRAVHVGDHQTTLDADLDRIGCSTEGGAGALELEMHNTENDMSDAFRHLHPNTPHYTWFPQNRSKGTYIDRTFTSHFLLPSVKACFAADISVRGPEPKDGKERVDLDLDHKFTVLDLELGDWTPSKSRNTWRGEMARDKGLMSQLGECVTSPGFREWIVCDSVARFAGWILVEVVRVVGLVFQGHFVQ